MVAQIRRELTTEYAALTAAVKYRLGRSEGITDLSSGRDYLAQTRDAVSETTIVARSVRQFLSAFNKAFIDIRLRNGIETPPEEDRATATGDLHKKFRKDRSSGSRDMLANRQTDTQTDGQTDRNTPLPYRGRVNICCGSVCYSLTFFLCGICIDTCS